MFEMVDKRIQLEKLVSILFKMADSLLLCGPVLRSEVTLCFIILAGKFKLGRISCDRMPELQMQVIHKQPGSSKLTGSGTVD